MPLEEGAEGLKNKARGEGVSANTRGGIRGY